MSLLDAGFDPSTQGLLAAAFQGLQASGPSRMPVSLGQIIGQGGAAGLNEYQQAMQMAQKKKRDDALMALEQQKAQLTQAQIDKMKADSAMQVKLMGLLGGDVSGGQGMNADKLDQLGTMLSLQLHPGGGVLTNLAERTRKAEDAKATMGLLQSQSAPITDTPAFGVNQGGVGTRSIIPQDAPPGQIPPEVLAASQAGKPFSIGVGPSANPAENVQRVGGLFANDMQSQDPAQASQGLMGQTLVDQASGRSANPQHFIDMQARLAAAAAARQQQVLMANMGAANRNPQVIQTATGPQILGKGATVSPITDASGQQVKPAAASRMGGMATGITSENAHLRGEDFISTLTPDMQNNVKALTSYTAPLSTFSTRTGDRAVMLAMAKQADPTFDEKKYPARSALVKDFTSGPASNNIVALDQGISHMGTLLKLGDAMQNNDIKGVNTVVNFVRDQMGHPEVNNFNTAKQAVGTELMRVFRQVNASEVETLAWEARFNSATSPEQLKGAIKTGAELLNGRLKALNQKWDKGMETNTGYPNLLSPGATAALQSFGVTPAGAQPNRRASDAAGMPGMSSIDAEIARRKLRR